MYMSKLHKVVKRGEFSMKFVGELGDVISVDRCVRTSWHSKGATMNIKLLVSGQIRKVNRYTIIEINGEPLCL